MGLFNGATAEEVQKESIELGVFVTSLYDLDTTKGHFGADVWIWSRSKNSKFDIKKLEVYYLNTKFPFHYDLDDSTSLGKGLVHSARKLSGTFLHNYNLENFPFDRQILELNIENTQEYAGVWDFYTDPQSGIDKSIAVEGWVIESAEAVVSNKRYNSDFGLINKNPEFSRVTLKIILKRQSSLLFFKLTLGLLVAIAIAIFACLLPSNNSELFSARVGLLGATLLAVVVSQQFADSQAGDTSSVTLIDLLHMLGTVCILLLFGSTLISRLVYAKNGNRNFGYAFDRVVVFSVSVLFFIISAVLTYHASRT